MDGYISKVFILIIEGPMDMTAMSFLPRQYWKSKRTRRLSFLRGEGWSFLIILDRYNIYYYYVQTN